MQRDHPTSPRGPPQRVRDFAHWRAALHRRRLLANRPLVAIGNTACPGSRSAIEIVEIGNVQAQPAPRTLTRPDRRGGAPRSQEAGVSSFSATTAPETPTQIDHLRGRFLAEGCLAPASWSSDRVDGHRR
jgi:hypothetical protein